jgi:hypothetical protein
MTAPDVELSLRRLLGPAEPEVGCDECFDQLDRYVELELSGEPAHELMPALRTHLDGCQACAEEHESLRALTALDHQS